MLKLCDRAAPVKLSVANNSTQLHDLMKSGIQLPHEKDKQKRKTNQAPSITKTQAPNLNPATSHRPDKMMGTGWLSHLAGAASATAHRAFGEGCTSPVHIPVPGPGFGVSMPLVPRMFGKVQHGTGK